MRLFASKKLKAFTLVEMLAAIFIGAMGMLGFSLLFSSSFKSNKFILETGTTAIQVNRAEASILNNLRKVRQADNGDYPLVSGNDFDLKAYVDTNNDGVTERVHYWLDTGAQQLKEGVTEPTGSAPVTYPAADGTVTTIASYIVNDASQPVFYYYNENYPGDTVNNPLPTPVSIQDVRLIRVLLRMNIDPVHAPDNINVESFVDLRNLESYAE